MADAEFPRRWQGAHFKGDRVLAKVARHRQNQRRVSAETANKAIARKRDKYCRFPLCGCGNLRLGLEVSHRVHKGQGGDPTGERSQPGLMLLLCVARHRVHRFSIDKKTLRWEPLTAKGANGPIRWLIDLGMLDGEPYNLATELQTGDGGVWVELASETSPHVYAALLPQQKAILAHLATMAV